jgi:hypothetical protein
MYYILEYCHGNEKNMGNKKLTNFKEFEAALLEKPGVRREYEALKPRYDMIRKLVKLGIIHG